MLYDMESPRASAGRGLVNGRIFTQVRSVTGVCVCVCVCVCACVRVVVEID